jgi:hypothetical protein
MVSQEKAQGATMSRKKKDPEYVFPKNAICPRCKTTDNYVTSTQGQIQYRKCRRGICRERFSVGGRLAKKTKKPNQEQEQNGRDK